VKLYYRETECATFVQFLSAFLAASIRNETVTLAVLGMVLEWRDDNGEELLPPSLCEAIAAATANQCRVEA
jgi:hypothetical protein